MYCPKCGQRLEEGDAFCTNCGTPVPKEEIVSRRKAAASPEFNWGLSEEFPQPRKRETMDFNWSSGAMTPRRDFSVPAESQETFVSATPEQPKETASYTMPRVTYEDLSVEEPKEPSFRNTASASLEESLFRDMERADEEAYTRQEEKFYTFTRKNEEFQKLLDREYEKIRRNGTPPERPIREEETLFNFHLEPEPIKEEPVYTEPRKSDTIVFETPAPSPVSEDTRQTIAYKAPVQTMAYKMPEGVSFETAPEVTARPEPTFQTAPEEIRTIWEEIKADMERENAEKIAKAAETERTEKMEVGRKTIEKAAPEDDSPLNPTAKAPRSTGEVAAVTATALTKIWEDDEEGGESEVPKKKGRFWLVLFLIILICLILVLAGILIQKFWPDTGAASFAADAEAWLKDVWESIKGLFNK